MHVPKRTKAPKYKPPIPWKPALALVLPIALLMGFVLYDSLRGTHHKRAHDTGAPHRHTHRAPEATPLTTQTKP